MQRHLLLFFTVLTIILCSCEEPTAEQKGSYLPSYVGKAGEIAVIIEDEHWKGRAGDTISEYLHQAIPLMPAYEPMFKLYQYPHKRFDRHLKRYRNILLVEIKDNINYQTPKVEMMKEKYAKDQMMIKVGARSVEDFVEAFGKKSQDIIELFNEAELERAIKYFERFHRESVEKKITEKHNYNILVPEQAELLENKDDFVWYTRDMSRRKDGRMHDVQQGILVYEYPYVDDSTFTKEYLLGKRDSILKKNVPGPVDSSWMATEYFYEPIFKPINLDDEYAAEIRGLWRIENAFMGGPFVSITRVDEKRGRVVTAEGYVFAPKFDKREYLREMEAVAKSLDFD